MVGRADPRVFHVTTRGKNNEQGSGTTKTQEPTLEARRAALRAEERAIRLEQDRRIAERVVAEIKRKQYEAEFEQLGTFLDDLQEKQWRDELEEKHRREERMQQLKDLAEQKGAFAPPPLSRREIEEEVAALGRFVDRLTAEEQAKLAKETEQALNRRIFERAFAKSWDARHPRGVDNCPCNGCKAWRAWRGR
jgi:hypothetical protein